VLGSPTTEAKAANPTDATRVVMASNKNTTTARTLRMASVDFFISMTFVRDDLVREDDIPVRKVTLKEVLRSAGRADMASTEEGLVKWISENRTDTWYRLLQAIKPSTSDHLTAARQPRAAPVDTRCWELFLFLGRRVDDLADVLVDADGPAETDGAPATAGTRASSGGGASAGGRSRVGFTDHPAERMPRVAWSMLRCPVLVSHQWRNFGGPSLPKLAKRPPKRTKRGRRSSERPSPSPSDEKEDADAAEGSSDAPMDVDRDGAASDAVDGAPDGGDGAPPTKMRRVRRGAAAAPGVDSAATGTDKAAAGAASSAPRDVADEGRAASAFAAAMTAPAAGAPSKLSAAVVAAAVDRSQALCETAAYCVIHKTTTARRVAPCGPFATP